jgi:hypothetical protein
VSTQHTTTYTHRCDVCERELAPSADSRTPLPHLIYEPDWKDVMLAVGRRGFSRGYTPQAEPVRLRADICPECEKLTIGELIAWFRRSI